MNTIENEQKPLPASVLQWYIEPSDALSNENIVKLFLQLSEECVCESMVCADNVPRNMYKVSPVTLTICAACTRQGLNFKAFGDEGDGIVPFETILVIGGNDVKFSLRPADEIDLVCAKASLESVCVKRHIPPPTAPIQHKGVKPWNARMLRLALPKAPVVTPHHLAHR